MHRNPLPRPARAAFVALAVSALPAIAADWPQWRGTARNGISPEKGWQASWPASGPKKAWQAQVGQGFSAVAVSGGRLYTMGNSGSQDTVWCLDANTGKVVWRHSYPCGSGDYGGPRATPAVSGGNVFTLSREGHAVCLNAASGKVVWSKQLAREVNADSPRWGFAGSPLVDGNLVIYNLGDGGAAVDKRTGRLAWKSGRGPAGYASPVAFNAGGQRGVAIFAGRALVAVEPWTGRKLWSFPWETNFDVNAADPIFTGDTVFISSNYGRGCALLKLAGGRPSVVWQNRDMKNHFNTCVRVGSAYFGNDENTLKCIDAGTGRERWRLRGIGKGGLIASDGKLLVLSERGELFTAQATPDRYAEISRARVLSGTCWTHPVLANGRIYCRSHEGTLVSLDVASRG